MLIYFMSEISGINSEIKPYEISVKCKKCGYSPPLMTIYDTKYKDAVNNAVQTILFTHDCPKGPLKAKDISIT